MTERQPRMASQQRLVEVFVELADTLVDDYDVIDLLHTLTEVTVELLDAQAAGLMLADQRGNVQVVASSSEESRVLELFELQHAQGPCIDSYRQGQQVINVDAAEAERRWPGLGAAVESSNFTSVHALPMRLRSTVVGAMNIFLTRTGELSDEDIALGQGLADIATIGLLQERAVKEQHILGEQLQGALNSRVLIEQAKGMFAERHGIEMSRAFTTMRAHARNTGRPLLAVANQVIDGTFDAEPLMRT